MAACITVLLRSCASCCAQVIALMNLLERFSQSLMYYREMSSQLAVQEHAVQGSDTIS